MVHNQLQAKDDCWCIEALHKWQPNKMHSKEMQYMKVHHEEVHHEEMHHEEVQLKLQRHKSDRWEKTTVGIHIEALYKLQPNKVHSKKMQYMKVPWCTIRTVSYTHLTLPTITEV